MNQDIKRGRTGYNAAAIASMTEAEFLEEADRAGYEKGVHADDEARVEALKAIHAEAKTWADSMVPRTTSSSSGGNYTGKIGELNESLQTTTKLPDGSNAIVAGPAEVTTEPSKTKVKK